MIAYKNGCKVDIWKIPTRRETERYVTIHIPPQWVEDGIKSGYIIPNQANAFRWAAVDLVLENGYKRAIPGEWICRFSADDFSSYTSKEIESQFRTPFGDDI